MALLLGTSGVLHFVAPKPFESIVPKSLGHAETLVRVSGAVELACAAGLALPRTRRLAGLASAALFVAVFPANVTMAVQDVRSSRTSMIRKAAVLARLPLQAPLITHALRLARGKAAAGV